MFCKRAGLAVILLAMLCFQVADAQSMKASWYADGARVAWHSARYYPDGFTVAHRTLPFGTRLRISYMGRSVEAIVNDRGPALWTHREIDVSRGVARALGIMVVGVAVVDVERLD